MRRVVLDSNVIDPIADRPGAYEAIRAAVDAARLEVLFTHITVEELAGIPDPERRSLLLLVLIDLGHLIPTGAAVVGFSRLDFCRLNDDTEALDAFRSGNIDHTRDALIAATAQFEQCALVTNDKRLTGRARERGVEVLTVFDLLSELGLNNPAV
jgi:predicted nucleic acid-binding protein